MVKDMKFAAYEIFGKMRNSTPEEQLLYEDMLLRMSTKIGVNIDDKFMAEDKKGGLWKHTVPHAAHKDVMA